MDFSDYTRVKEYLRDAKDAGKAPDERFDALAAAIDRIAESLREMHSTLRAASRGPFDIG